MVIARHWFALGRRFFTGWRGVAALGLLALALTWASRADRDASSLTQVVAPLWDIVAAPVRWAGIAMGGVGDYTSAIAERDRLAQENAALLRWRALALALDEKRRVYEALLLVAAEPAATQVSARVVAESGGPFVNALVVMAGRGDGVRSGQAALGEGGLLGRVVAVGPIASRILLLGDLNARSPVLVEGRGVSAVLVGDNRPRPRLESAHGRAGATESLAAGDRVMTSGHGGLLPPGLPVGILVRGRGERGGERGGEENEGVWRVALFAEPRAASYVRLLRYDLARSVSGG